MEALKTTLVLKGDSVPCRANIPIWKAMAEKGFSRSAYLTTRNGVLITDDEMIAEGDTIELIPVVSGG